MRDNPPSPRQLTKSHFVLGLRCRKALYFDLFSPERIGLESSQYIKSQLDGKEVGLYARGLYPEGKLIESKDIGRALQETKESIGNGSLTIFEAAFAFEDVVIRADILTREFVGAPWKLYEVKAATAKKEEWLHDLAIQAWVVQRAGIHLESVFLMHLNSDCIFPDLENLFHIHDCKDCVESLMCGMAEEIEEMRKILLFGEEPEGDIGPHCEDSYVCPFKSICWQHMPKFSVFNIPRFRKKWEFYEANRYAIESLTEADFGSEIMKRVLRCHQTNQLFFDPQTAQKALKAWKYPICYFDLETVNYPIPRYHQNRPYQQIPFQFSCHIQRTVDSDLEHCEFLYDGIEDPRPDFMQKMLAAIPSSGSIVVYHKGFEVSRFEELAQGFPEYAQAINELIQRIVDLEHVITQTTYHPDFLGSFSIKKVAPAILGERADYCHLEVGNGVEAMLNYQERFSLDIDDPKRAQITKNLLEYCKQDTMLMVYLHRWLWKQITKLTE
jgi:hypothetical protein